MSVFAAALDALFADPNLAMDALYAPAGGDPMTVRVIVRRPDAIVGFGDTRIHAATAMVDVRVAELAAPEPGDTLEVGGETYVAQGEPIRDAERLVWTMEARPQ